MLIGHYTREVIDTIDISDYVRTFLLQLSELEHDRIRINSEWEAERIKALLNIPKNTMFKSPADLRSGVPYWNEQEVDYVRSNLKQNKGFIFYFICGQCDRRVKRLFFYTLLEPPICRHCCRLPYRQKSYKERKMSHGNGKFVGSPLLN